MFIQFDVQGLNSNPIENLTADQAINLITNFTSFNPCDVWVNGRYKVMCLYDSIIDIYLFDLLEIDINIINNEI